MSAYLSILLQGYESSASCICPFIAISTSAGSVSSLVSFLVVCCASSMNAFGLSAIRSEGFVTHMPSD